MAVCRARRGTLVRPGHRRRAARRLRRRPARRARRPGPRRSDDGARARTARSRMSDDADIDRIAGAFADIVDAKSPYTGSHSQRVARVRRRRGAAAGPAGRATSSTSAARACSTTSASSASRTSILDKPARLEPREFEVIRRHPELTLRILEPMPTFGERGRDGRQPPRAARRARLLPRHDRAGAVDGCPDRGRRRRLRGADGGPAVPDGDADRAGARDPARVGGRAPRRATSSRRWPPLCRERDAAPDGAPATGATAKTSPGTRACPRRRSRR